MAGITQAANAGSNCGRASTKMSCRVMALLLLFALAGCFDDQKQQLARCDLDARHRYPNEMPFTKYTEDVKLHASERLRLCGF
jgi:hypothetical protein